MWIRKIKTKQAHNKVLIIFFLIADWSLKRSTSDFLKMVCRNYPFALKKTKNKRDRSDTRIGKHS